MVQFIGKIDLGKLGEYGRVALTDDVILTDERLYNHILIKHKKDYEFLSHYLNQIIVDPDIILSDNKNENTLILLKNISNIHRRKSSNQDSGCKR